MKKKLTTVLSAMLLVGSLLSTNAAAATTASKYTTKITSECPIPSVTIDVVVPSSEKVYVNPSKVSVKLNGSISDAQIVTEVGCIENRSAVPISVSASVSASIKSGSTMKLSNTSTKNSGSTAKQAFVFLQMQPISDPEAKINWDKTYDADKHILVTTNTKSKKDFVTLGRYDAEDENSTSKRYGAFMMTGDCVTLPKDAWTTKDGFTANVVFTFKALPYTTEA
jgi:Tfp pilus assembly protein PilV